MILFRATSHHQLVNAIAIKVHDFPNVEADLILSTHTDFTPYLDAIRSCGLFRKVFYVDDVSVSHEFVKKPMEERLKFTRNVENLWGIELDKKYTDYFYGHEVLCNKLFYYYLLKVQKDVIPHSFQEGCSSYLVNSTDQTRIDSIDHAYYKEKSLKVCLKDMYFYNPNLLLYTPTTVLKTIDLSNPLIGETVLKIYNPPPIPKEKYMYFAVSSEYQGVSSNEVELLDMIAKVVGKENIIIKNHPRCSFDKFTYRGYKVMQTSVAAEALCYTPGIRDKVLIAPISTSLMSAQFILQKNFNAILVNELLSIDLSRFIKENELMDELLRKMINVPRRFSEQSMFYARSEESFREIIRYIEGRTKA
ncbi:MAG: hypothetical protein ACI4Q4_03240 [Oscillospiraceae bacterium]